jgi:hypothetical protein
LAAVERKPARLEHTRCRYGSWQIERRCAFLPLCVSPERESRQASTRVQTMLDSNDLLLTTSFLEDAW